MPVEWDPVKAQQNMRKHGVSFADAVTALEDDRSLTERDLSADEERWVTMGIDGLGRLLVVVYTWVARTFGLFPPELRPIGSGECMRNENET